MHQKARIGLVEPGMGIGMAENIDNNRYSQTQNNNKIMTSHNRWEYMSSFNTIVEFDSGKLNPSWTNMECFRFFSFLAHCVSYFRQTATI